jgi:hypothetical protein
VDPVLGRVIVEREELIQVVGDLVFRAHGGKIADENRIRSPVTGSCACR